MTAPSPHGQGSTRACLRLEPRYWEGKRAPSDCPRRPPARSPPSRPHPGVLSAGPGVPTVSGEAQAGSCPPEPPSPAAAPPPGYLQGRPPGAAPWPSRAARGARAPGRGVVRVRAGGAPRVALPAAPRGCRSGRAGGAGGPGGGGRGAAGRGLHPLSTAAAKARAPPGRARAQPGLDLRLPPATHSETPHPATPRGSAAPCALLHRTLCQRLGPPALWGHP